MTALPDFSNQRMLAGVCLWLSQKLGWSVWGLRAAAVLGLWLNPLITGIVYLVTGWWVNRDRIPESEGQSVQRGTRGKHRRPPVVIDQQPGRVKSQRDDSAQGQPDIHAHSEKVEALLRRYRALDEQLDRRA